jgi:hypothetical protein
MIVRHGTRWVHALPARPWGETYRYFAPAARAGAADVAGAIAAAVTAQASERARTGGTLSGRRLAQDQ